MNQIFRQNLKYILVVLLVWATTFPWILQNRDLLLSRFHLAYNALFGYPNPRIARSLVTKGDSILENRKQWEKGFFASLRDSLSTGPEPQATLPLDLTLMEKSCLYFRNKEHVEDHFMDLSWREKAKEWGSPLFQKMATPGVVSLGPDPKSYWRSHIDAVLEALDYYKRALRFSGPDLLVPKKIESVAWATCRPSEILSAYKTHMVESESFVLTKLQDQKAIPSGLSEVQIRTILLSAIKRGEVADLPPNDYLESLLRQILLSGMKNFSPREMESVYERILYFVGSDEREYLKFKFRRGELFFQLGSEDPSYYEKAIREFQEASNIDLASTWEDINLPALLVHEFESKLAEANTFIKLKQYSSALRTLDGLSPKLRNVDERSVGGKKFTILKNYNDSKRYVLRKLGRFEEADEIPILE